MARGFTDWTEYSLNDKLKAEDWTEDFVGSGVVDPEVLAAAGTPGGRAVRAFLADLGGGANYAYSWDILPSAENWETLILGRQQTTDNHNWGAVLRMSGSGAYFGVLRNNGTDERIGFFTDNSDFTSLAVAAHGINTEEWLWQRTRVNGTTVQVKTWQADLDAADFGMSDEPASWALTETDSNITGSGKAGLYLRPSANSTWVEWGYFGWGSDGDVAPDPAPQKIHQSRRIVQVRQAVNRASTY